MDPVGLGTNENDTVVWASVASVSAIVVFVSRTAASVDGTVATGRVVVVTAGMSRITSKFS